MPVSKRSLLLNFFSLFLLSFSAVSGDSIREGAHYLRIKPAQPTSAPAGKIEIAEMFWYGCPHCFRFEPFLEQWLKRNKDKVEFVRIPAVINPKWEVHGRAYYAAEAMGIVDKLHKPLFSALHVERKRIYKKKDIIDFVATLGIDTQKFSATMDSFSVSSKIQRAKKLGQVYRINGVPSIIVNGKYLTSGSQAGSFEGLVQVMDYLKNQELASTTAKLP